MKKLLLLLILSATMFSACKKEDNEPTVKELLTRKWKVTSSTINGNYSDHLNGSTMHFKSDGRFSEFNVPDNQEYNGDWDLMNNNAISFSYDLGLQSVMGIQRIEKSVLQLTDEETINGVFYRLVVTLE